MPESVSSRCLFYGADAGEGIAIHPYGDLRAGHFALSPLLKQAAYVQINGDNTMHCRALGAELENSASEIPDEPASAESMSVDLAALPQKLLVEVGQVTLTLESLRTLQVGDTVAVNAEFSPEVTLKLNGRAIGKGALIGCGDRFWCKSGNGISLHKIERRWVQDGVNAR